ncbi:hypothetical protein [Deinococcus koreensis]|uniref:Transglutaminase-like domain-containing protein n=1 Tax=Deinococcus koreensis TaxID=2054903 RepID=A0A2K3UUA1_9DEIO|nr:hypothetical protein [Deinococcus koreensis]PNY80113.1 hypothetical protein CVO96_00970 [Deinococcus koreensis]
MTRPLAQLLHAEAVRRGQRSGHALPDERDLFELVRDLPYARASGHEPETVIREWRGTCSTKHELLAALYSELGLESTIYACTQEIRLPDGAAPELAAWEGEPVIDVHNYLVLHESGGNRLIDATWPLAARAAGLPANEWGHDMQIACTPLETWALGPGEDVAAFKEARLRERYTPEQLQRRDEFIRAVGRLFTGG